MITQDIFSSVNEEVHAISLTDLLPEYENFFIPFNLHFLFQAMQKSHSISAKLMITDKDFCTVLSSSSA